MRKLFIFFLLTLLVNLELKAQSPPVKPQKPIMGWSSWNNFRVNINENIIKAQADAMLAKGLTKAGYQFVNIDDGFFGGRDKDGNLLVHPQRFPSGMKALADYIHAKGLKAGIYSDAGINTCASMWDRDSVGLGAGLYLHDEKDLNLMLKIWGYDFIKVDWCGAKELGLSEEMRYTQIAKTIERIKPSTIFNICRWEFPGIWAVGIADSWRISGDISNKFSSILHIIDKNADLWKYSSPGHYNDMDMLQVGRGMSIEEDKSHFAMWCMMNSPLLLGNDLRTMSQQTLELVTNKELIALNQDDLGYQARRFEKQNDVELWAKPLQAVQSGKVAVALLNRANKPASFVLDLGKLGFDLVKPIKIRDLWKQQNLVFQGGILTFNLKAHETIVLRVEGTSKRQNLFQTQ